MQKIENQMKPCTLSKALKDDPKDGGLSLTGHQGNAKERKDENKFRYVTCPLLAVSSRMHFIIKQFNFTKYDQAIILHCTAREIWDRNHIHFRKRVRH